jgi:hypothetical protein
MSLFVDHLVLSDLNRNWVLFKKKCSTHMSCKINLNITLEVLLNFDTKGDELLIF